MVDVDAHVTDFHVSWYAQSPFIAHMLLHGKSSLTNGDQTIQAANEAIQSDILQSKFLDVNAWDICQEEWNREKLVSRMISAVVTGDIPVILNPVVYHKFDGIPHQGRADVLHRVQNGVDSGHQYMVKVVTCQVGQGLRPYMVMKALFFHYVLSSMLGKDWTADLENFAIFFFILCPGFSKEVGRVSALGFACM